jgi:hypothetical protein
VVERRGQQVAEPADGRGDVAVDDRPARATEPATTGEAEQLGLLEHLRVHAVAGAPPRRGACQTSRARTLSGVGALPAGASASACSTRRRSAGSPGRSSSGPSAGRTRSRSPRSPTSPG